MRVNQSIFDGKNRCSICENMFFRNIKDEEEEKEDRKPKKNLEKLKEYKKCQSRMHEEKNDKLPVNQSKIDDKNRCTVCENMFLRNIKEEEEDEDRKPKKNLEKLKEYKK